MNPEVPQNSPAPGPQIAGILQIAIPVRDIARATAFYRDALGLRFLFAAPNMAFFDCAGVRLYLDANGAYQSAGPNQFIYFRTADIHAQPFALKAKNVVIHREPHVIARMPGSEIWLMWIRDSEGNLLALMEERKAAAV
ncbi:MAG TPA: VOC family protein [Candidatus Acidoferrum sp.]|nr:VOC family protein [Candidatus Acidoferrum sp.]